MSAALLRRIREQIERAGGRITFADYMRAALYDPEDGFFAGSPVGRGAHFVTSPHVSPVFGALLAEQVRATRDLLAVDDFTVVELGAGDGTLARQILHACPDVSYIAVEQSDAARAAMPAGVTAVPSLDDVEQFHGIAIANELLDNIPLHRMRATSDGDVVEVFVGAGDGGLVEVVGAPSIEAPPLPGAHEWTVSPEGDGLVVALRARIGAGHVLLVDYGFVHGEEPEPVRGYRGQQMVHDLLDDPGSCDITGPVDFTGVAAAAGAAGFDVHGPVSQRDALLRLGYRRALGAMRAEQADAEARGDHRRAIELYSLRNEAAMLVEPAGLGGLKVLGLSTPGLPAPAALG